jgi:hypothetical protein
VEEEEAEGLKKVTEGLEKVAEGLENLIVEEKVNKYI